MTEPIILGPVFTAYGFRSWLLVCHSDVLVAARIGFWNCLAGNNAFLMSGAIGGALGGGVSSSLRRKAEEVRAMTPSELRSMPGALVYPIEKLTAIVYKCRKMTSSELILESGDRDKIRFGITDTSAQKSIVEALVALYGELVQES